MNRYILTALIFFSRPVHAQGLSLDTLLDDTGGAPEPALSNPASLWPAAVTVDQVYRTVNIDWPGQPDETLPFGAIIQIEHARAWDGHPEELFVMFGDGRRVVIGRGANVPEQVSLMRAWLAERIIELPPGAGHGVRPDGVTDPQLTVSAAGAEIRLGGLEPSPSSPPAKTKKPSCEDCLEKQDLDRVVKQRMGEIRGCFQRASQQDPDLAGEVVVRFQVTASGAIGSATIKRSTLQNSVVEACIREQFLKMVFPRPPGNKPIQASYPVVFTPSR